SSSKTARHQHLDAQAHRARRADSGPERLERGPALHRQRHRRHPGDLLSPGARTRTHHAGHRQPSSVITPRGAYLGLAADAPPPKPEHGSGFQYSVTRYVRCALAAPTPGLTGPIAIEYTILLYYNFLYYTGHFWGAACGRGSCACAEKPAPG